MIAACSIAGKWPGSRRKLFGFTQRATSRLCNTIGSEWNELGTCEHQCSRLVVQDLAMSEAYIFVLRSEGGTHGGSGRKSRAVLSVGGVLLALVPEHRGSSALQLTNGIGNCHPSSVIYYGVLTVQRASSGGMLQNDYFVEHILEMIEATGFSCRQARRRKRQAWMILS